MRLERIVTLFLGMLLLGGCMRSKRDQIPFLQKNYKAENTTYRMSTKSIIRVVVLPLVNYSAKISEDSMKLLQDSLVQALLKIGRFECIFEHTENFIYEYPRLPYRIFDRLSEKYNADAVMFMGVTDYCPYTPLRIGIKAQLVEVGSEKIIWAIDELFDGGREDVMYGVKNFRRGHAQQVFESLDQLGQLSPKVFSVYVGRKIFETIPENF